MVYSLINVVHGVKAPYKFPIGKVISYDKDKIVSLRGDLSGILPSEYGLEGKDISDFVNPADIMGVDQEEIFIDFGGPVSLGNYLTFPIGEGVKARLPLETVPRLPSYQESMPDVVVGGFQVIYTPKNGLTFISFIPEDMWQSLKGWNCQNTYGHVGEVLEAKKARIEETLDPDRRDGSNVVIFNDFPSNPRRVN